MKNIFRSTIVILFMAVLAFNAAAAPAKGAPGNQGAAAAAAADRIPDIFSGNSFPPHNPDNTDAGQIPVHEISFVEPPFPEDTDSNDMHGYIPGVKQQPDIKFSGYSGPPVTEINGIVVPAPGKTSVKPAPNARKTKLKTALTNKNKSGTLIKKAGTYHADGAGTLVKDLKLTNEQALNISSLEKKTANKNAQYIKKINTTMDMLRTELSKDSPDEELINSLVDRIAGYNKEILKNQVYSILSLKNTLTREQFENVKDSIKGRHNPGK